MTDQIVSTGIEIDTLEERLENIQSDLRSNISANLDLSTDTPIGQLVSIVAEKIQSVAELVEEAYGQFDPDQATGNSLSSLSRLTGTVKQAATKGTVTLSLDLDAATTVPAGSIVAVVGDADNQWETDDAVTSAAALVTTGAIAANLTYNNANPDTIVRTDGGSFIADGFAATDVIKVVGSTLNDGYYTIDTVVAATITLVATDSLTADAGDSGTITKLWPAAATATEKGVINASLGTITSIISSVAGWNAVTNMAAANPGEDLETDTELRLRREREIARRGSSSVASIQAGVSAVEGVVDVTVYNNPSPFASADVPAPHAFHVVVWDGIAASAVNADLAEAIFDNAPAGIKSYGSTAVTHTDDQNIDHTISFSRPTQKTIDVEITVYELSNYAGDTAVQTAIEDMIDALPPGEDVRLSDVIEVANEITGVDYVSVNQATPSPGLAINPAAVAFSDVTIATDEKAVAGTVTVTSV